MSDDASVIARAVGYPYDRPSSSFLYGLEGPGTWVDLTPSMSRVGSARAMLEETPEEDIHAAFAGRKEPLARNRTSVLAIGSNAAPQQLARKYKNDGSVIPVLKAELAGFDVVYTPLITSYGSIAATLLPSTGASRTAVALFVTLLDDAQLRRMHETEGGYHVARIVNVSDRLRILAGDGEDGGRWNWPESVPAYAYVSRRGVALVDRAPVALAKIGARDRTLLALDQRGMQNAVMGLLDLSAKGGDAEDSADTAEFILDNVRKHALRAKRNQELSTFGMMPASEGAWILMESDDADLILHGKHVD
jgi:hypothetical protein